HNGITADDVIEANGMVIAPGFIDPHTHTLRDLQSETKNTNLNYLLQGVTTVVNGNDGGGPVLIEKTLTELDSNGIGTNAALFVGHRTARRLVMNMDDRPPTAEELEQMRSLVDRGMQEGALGFSSGLFYVPASFAATEEVIELAKVAAKYQGLYDVHLRDESTYNIGLLAAIEETIEIAEKAKIRANIAHIKALGVDVWGLSPKIIATVEAARDRGVAITADQYPFEASSTALSAALVPRWVFADIDRFTTRFDDPQLLPRIKKEMAENLRRRGGANAILLIAASDSTYNGKTLKELAEIDQIDPIDMAIRVLKKGGSAIASFNMSDEDIENLMAKPWVMTSSDGGSPHPRKYASFSKKIRKYVFEKDILDLARMVHQSTGLTAEVLGISKRGKLELGYFADVIVFDPSAVKDHATYQEPAQLSEGMSFVVLNGKVVVTEGQFQDILAGRSLRRGSY
ncbi:MAG: amidohydrolase family protein, partial [Bacteroidota bacterium]